MKRYDFLLFDLDYTLLDFDADMLMAFKRLYEHWGFHKTIPYTKNMLDIYEKHNDNWWRRFEAGKCTKPQLFTGRFEDFLAETGLDGNAQKMNEDYFNFLGNGGVPYPGALEMLSTLSEKAPIYIITNGNSSTAKTRIENSGISKLIKGYFVSETIGCAKPDSKYFEYVFSSIPGFSRDRAIVIGDSLLTDICGAKRMNVDSIWYNPGSKEIPEIPEYTYMAETFDDILGILK